MRTLLAGAAFVLLSIGAAAPASAQSFTGCTPDCTLSLSGSAEVQAVGGRNFIDFGPQTVGSATFTFGTLVPAGGQYVVEIVGQNSANATFVFTSGMTSLGTFNLGGFAIGDVDVSFNVVSTAAGVAVTATTSGGNLEGKIDTVSVRAVPAPIAGAGLPVLAMMAGAWFIRRRKQKLDA
jgi:hypothetical protein